VSQPATGVIEATGLTRSFGSVLALREVTLHVARGETLVVFGPNGAGKTTLLRLLTLSLRPDGGSLRIDGLDPRKHDARIRARIGLISHPSYLYDDLTPRQNLLFYAQLYGVDDALQRVGSLLEQFGLTARADDPVRTLSRGMQQRTSLARALVHDPPIVLLDEPFTGLDPLAADVLRTRLATLGEQGRTVVLVTHDLRQGLELADRWVMIAGGRVVDTGLSADTDFAGFQATYLSRLAPAGKAAGG